MLDYWSKDMFNFDFLEKGVGIVFLKHFVYDYYQIAFSSPDIGQHVYWNCLLTRLWRHQFWNYPNLSNQAISQQDWKAKIKE